MKTFCGYQGRIQDFRRRGRQPSSKGRQHIFFTTLSEKLHEIEKILVRKGVRAGRPPLDPLMVTNMTCKKINKGINTDNYLARFRKILPLIKFISFALIVHYYDEKCFENYAALTRRHAAYFVFLLH